MFLKINSSQILLIKIVLSWEKFKGEEVGLSIEKTKTMLENINLRYRVQKKPKKNYLPKS